MGNMNNEHCTNVIWLTNAIRLIVVAITLTILIPFSFSVSSTNGRLSLWASTHVTITSRLPSAIISSFSLGVVATGIVTGYVFQEYSPFYIMVISMVAAVFQLVFFVAAYVSVRFIQMDVKQACIEEREESILDST